MIGELEETEMSEEEHKKLVDERKKELTNFFQEMEDRKVKAGCIDGLR